MDLQLELVILLNYLICLSQSITNKMPNIVECEVYALENCANPGNGDISYVSNEIVNPDGQHPSLNGTLVIMKDITVAAVLSVDISNFVNGAWRPNFFNLELPFCKVPETVFTSTEDIEAIMPSMSCPVPAGEYDLKRLKIKRTLKFNMVPYGKYKADVILNEGNKRTFCKTIYSEIRK